VKSFQTSVSHLSISEERKAELEATLREGNVLLKHYHEKMKESLGLSKHNRTPFLNEIAKNYCQGKDVVVFGITIPADDAKKIYLVKKTEGEIICAHSNLINKIANKWFSINNDIALSLEDLKSEAYDAALDAVSHFIKEVKFSTFLHHCVRRRLSRVCRKTNGLSDLSTETAKLKTEYSVLATEEGATFDNIVEKMRISGKEIHTLQSVLTRVQNMTSLDKEDKDRMVIVDDSVEPEPENNILELVKTIDFSPLEKAVLEGVLNSPNTKLGIGSATKDLINPETNKPYSRMAFSLAWKRIKKKIADAYGKAA
jgi:DNA-directed RNA polymerase specialized sigma subunit